MSKKVLFVCTGNTCRSPMAEGLFKKAIDGNDAFECIGSAGVAAYTGDTISPETSEVLKKNEANLEGFRSRAVSDYLLAEATHVFAMTNSHLGMLVDAFPDHADKCYLVCDFVELNGEAGVDVPDPIGMGPLAYQQVAEVLGYAIPGILEFMDAQTEEV